MGKRQRSPLTGYNHNLGHLGRVFHVQTEDSGPSNPRLFTHLFFQGTILASRKLEYDGGLPDDQVRVLMQTQHKTMIRDLLQARLDERILVFFGERVADPAAVDSGGVALAVAISDDADTGATAEPAGGASAVGEAPPSGATVDVPAGVGDPRVVVPEAPPPVAVAASAPAALPAPPAAALTPSPESIEGDSAVPLPVSPRHETRPFGAAARNPNPNPTPTPLVVREQRRAPPPRNAPAPEAKAGASDVVVVQRSVVVGGGGAATDPPRPPRPRPSVPYVVTGSGNAQRAGKPGATLQPPTPPPRADPSAAAAAAAGSNASGTRPAPPPVEAPRANATGAFGLGLPDDKSLDDVILEYLGEDGETR